MIFSARQSRFYGLALTLPLTNPALRLRIGIQPGGESQGTRCNVGGFERGDVSFTGSISWMHMPLGVALCCNWSSCSNVRGTYVTKVVVFDFKITVVS